MKRKGNKPKSPAFPRAFETYQMPSYETCIQLKPSCFNGIVRVERYRVTIEKIEEPREVIRDRLVELWRSSERNSHLWSPMRDAARRLLEVSEEEAEALLPYNEQGVIHRSRE